MTLEPKSGTYKEPIAVLDYQSLYPSLICALGLGYGTFLGMEDQVKLIFGKSDQNFVKISDKLKFKITEKTKSEYLKSSFPIVKTQNGAIFIYDESKMFVSKMLQRILQKRFYYKTILKYAKKQKDTDQIVTYDAKQEQIKLVANTTYGYMAANFSGRMPCSKIADAVVGSGRTTLFNTINLVNKDPQMEVVYGDTDSVFIKIKTDTREKAFYQSEHFVNDINSKIILPMKLKFEKIYQPCILETKKRYMGLMYEEITDKKGVLSFKGVENVRRDFTISAGKLLTHGLRMVLEPEQLRELGFLGHGVDFHPTKSFVAGAKKVFVGYKDLRNLAICRKLKVDQGDFEDEIAKKFDTMIKSSDEPKVERKPRVHAQCSYKLGAYDSELETLQIKENAGVVIGKKGRKRLNALKMTKSTDGTSKLQFHEMFDNNNQKSDLSRTNSENRKTDAENNAKNDQETELNPEKLKTSLAAAAERAIIANKQLGYETCISTKRVPCFISRKHRATRKSANTVYERVLSEKDVLRARRNGEQVDLDLAYIFWKQSVPAVIRSIGLDDKEFDKWFWRLDTFGSDEVKVEGIAEDVIEKYCGDCVGNNQSCSNLHCVVNYEW